MTDIHEGKVSDHNTLKAGGWKEREIGGWIHQKSGDKKSPFYGTGVYHDIDAALAHHNKITKGGLKKEDLQEDHHHSDTELSHEARELVLHGDNNSHLYHTSAVPIRKNLNKKIKSGKYDHEKAKKLWGYHADRAAQSYTKEHGHPGQKWHEMFPPKHRKAAAAHWADEHHESIMSGAQDHVHEEMVAQEIVFAAMEDKPVDLSRQFAEAILIRSRMIIDDMKDGLKGKFMEGEPVDEARKPENKIVTSDGKQYRRKYYLNGISETGKKKYRYTDHPIKSKPDVTNMTPEELKLHLYGKHGKQV